ncbi:MAG: hypothetical protein WCP06_00545 [Verrucomicrobiota bacterium]
MKTNKEQIQKFFLIALLAFGGLYCYFDLLINPLEKRETAALKRMEELEPKIKEAKRQLNRTRAVEESDVNAVRARQILDVMKASIPAGASVAWLPPKLSEFFARQGVKRPLFRLNSETSDPDMPGYKASFWGIEIPKIEFAALAIAIAGLENQEGLLQIRNLQIDAVPLDVQFQRAQVTISTVVKE